MRVFCHEPFSIATIILFSFHNWFRPSYWLDSNNISLINWLNYSWHCPCNLAAVFRLIRLFTPFFPWIQMTFLFLHSILVIHLFELCLIRIEHWKSHTAARWKNRHTVIRIHRTASLYLIRYPRGNIAQCNNYPHNNTPIRSIHSGGCYVCVYVCVCTLPHRKGTHWNELMRILFDRIIVFCSSEWLARNENS